MNEIDSYAVINENEKMWGWLGWYKVAPTSFVPANTNGWENKRKVCEKIPHRIITSADNYITFEPCCKECFLATREWNASGDWFLTVNRFKVAIGKALKPCQRSTGLKRRWL